GTLNFGTRLEVTNDGGGVCTIDSDIEESIEWDETGISTSTTSWQTAATLTFTPLTAGDDWIIEFSFYSMTADDDEWNRHRILVDDTDQYHYLRWIHPLADVHWGWAGTIILEGLSAAAHTVKIQGYPEGSWTTLTIGDCFLRARKT
ncbi:hypothetical protein KJ782_07180, partial [Patescibacteria group bacterium]|nr:hypothetical protein [Patescibacteria group bacterium]